MVTLLTQSRRARAPFLKILGIAVVFFLGSTPIEALAQGGAKGSDGITPHPLPKNWQGIAIELDPQRWELVPYFYEEFPERPCTLNAWRKALGEPMLVLNGVQYETDFAAIGQLRRDGKPIGRTRKTYWKAHGVFGGPADRPFRIVDLLRDRWKINRLPGRHSFQSLMLFDATGKNRVQDSGLLARRTILGESRSGRAWIFLIDTPVSLTEAADTLKSARSPYDLRSALNLDGGPVSTLRWTKPPAPLGPKPLQWGLPQFLGDDGATENRPRTPKDCWLPSVLATRPLMSSAQKGKGLSVPKN